VDFFRDSPCSDDGAWRVLMNLQEELRSDEHGLVRNGGDSSTELGAEDAESVRAGALRPLEFDPTAHVVLGEELKHLYTAITRAKSNVIFSDSSPTLRAPFYRLLRSLGLARAVRESLLADGTAPEVVIDALLHMITHRRTAGKAPAPQDEAPHREAPPKNRTRRPNDQGDKPRRTYPPYKSGRPASRDEGGPRPKRDFAGAGAPAPSRKPAFRKERQ
jgi:hypothetical protein